MNPTSDRLTFRIADQPWEFEQIHRLNYATFVEEIPQHQANPDHRLVDRFHDDNVYFVCLLEEKEVVGMICLREKSPFSLESKVKNMRDLLPPTDRICEVRLLSVLRAFRYSRVFFGLLNILIRYCLDKGFEVAIISGTTRQLRLYKHLGFRIFADPVGTPEALYYPMYLTAGDVLPSLVNSWSDHES